MLIAIRSLYESQAAGVSLSLAAVEGADTAASAVGLNVSASLGATEGADLASGTVGLVITTALAATEGADNAAATAGLVISGDLSAIEGADSASSAVDLVVSASLSAVEGADLASATVQTPVGSATFNLAATEGADTAYAAIGDEARDNQPIRVIYLRKRKKEPRKPLILDIDTNIPDEEETVPVAPIIAAKIPTGKAAALKFDHSRWMTIPAPVVKVRAPKPPVARLVPADEARRKRNHALRLLLLAS